MRIKPEWQKRIALERIQILFRLAGLESKENPKRAKRYLELARKIGMRYNVRIPKGYKRQMCKKCKAVLIPGTNCKIRVKEKKLVVSCKCGRVSRFPLK